MSDGVEVGFLSARLDDVSISVGEIRSYCEKLRSVAAVCPSEAEALEMNRRIDGAEAIAIGVAAKKHEITTSGKH